LRRINKSLGDKNSTAQVKDIKPGVLSKIMNITEKASSNQPMDENLKRLITVAKGLEETLFEYAHYKPVKKKFLLMPMMLKSKKKKILLNPINSEISLRISLNSIKFINNKEKKKQLTPKRKRWEAN